MAAAQQQQITEDEYEDFDEYEDGDELAFDDELELDEDEEIGEDGEEAIGGDLLGGASSRLAARVWVPTTLPGRRAAPNGGPCVAVGAV